jgi:hypothetical protein
MTELTFRQIIGKLAGTNNVGFYMIHLTRAVERLPFVRQLEEKLQTPLTIFEAADGAQLVREGHPTTCQQRGPPFTRGAGCIGCTVSHIRICRDALENGYDYVVIFEDDCDFSSDLTTLESEVNRFVDLRLSWDLFLLGWDPQVSSPVSNSSVSKVTRFNLTHAGVLSRNFMKETIRTYEDYIGNNTTLSIDTMYSNIVEQTPFDAYGFTQHGQFFVQRSGIYSYVVEKIR